MFGLTLGGVAMTCDCNLRVEKQNKFSSPPLSPQFLRMTPLPSSSSISLIIHSRYLSPYSPSSSSSSQPSLHRSPAIKSIAIFPALFPGCGVSQAAGDGVGCPCELSLTPHAPDAWTFSGVPVGQCAPHASRVSF